MDSHSIEVVKASFSSVVETNWEELFDGFDEMYAITFSTSGVGFVNKVLGMFRYAEVVFGNEGVLKPDLAGIVAFQASTGYIITTSKSADKLRQRIEEGTVKCFFARDVKSHEKVFILKAGDGRTRVVTGSANMSYAALNNVQREVILSFEDASSYEYWKKRFDEYKEQCADVVSHETVNGPLAIASPNDIENSPVMQAAKVANIVVDSSDDDLESKEDDSNAILCVDMAKTAAQLRKLMPKASVSKVSRGAILVKAGKIDVLLKKYKQELRRRMKTSAGLPMLVLDIASGKLTYAANDETKPSTMNLSPDNADVAADAERMLVFLDGLQKSNGSPSDILRTQKAYFQFLCWCFMTVFFPYLRRIAAENGHDVNAYPMFCIIYGNTYGGKSTVTSFATRLMTGHIIELQSAANFTTTNVRSMRMAPTGFPIVYDDVEMKRWSGHAKDAIKEDMFGLSRDVYPAVIVTSNSVLSVGGAEARRMFTLRVSTTMDRRPVDNIVRSSVDTATSALFCEFVKRMIPVARQMGETMENTHDTPDAMESASRVLTRILGEHHDLQNHPYAKIFSYDDWGSENAVAYGIVEKLKTAYVVEPKLFSVDRKRNLLSYAYPENANAELLQQYVDELPGYVRAELMGRTLTMELDKMEELCGMKFKNKIKLFGK